jgi:hypothetical protein
VLAGFALSDVTAPAQQAPPAPGGGLETSNDEEIPPC